MSNSNMDIKSLRKNIYSELLSKQTKLHHATFNKLRELYESKKSKKTLLKFLNNELKFFNAKGDTFEKYKEIKREKKAFINQIKDKTTEIKKKYQSVVEVKVTEEILSDLRNALKEFIGRTVMVEYVVNSSKTGVTYVN